MAANKRFFWIVAAAIFATGCEQVPTLTDGKTSTEAPLIPTNIYPPFVLEVSPVMSFDEGQTGSFQIRAKVPGTGKPVVQVLDLPEGAVFSPDDLTINWTPDFKAGGDESNPSELEKMYPIRVRMQSSDDSVTTVERTSMLIVHDVLRPITFKSAAAGFRVTEGGSIAQDFRIISEDFPKGPFDLRASGLPAGAFFEKVAGDPGLFYLRYSPDFGVVNVDKAAYYETPMSKKFSIDLTAVGPRNVTVAKPITLTVEDLRQKPTLLAPTSIHAGSEVSIPVSSDDPNAETVPVISVDPRPTFGRIQIQNSWGVEGIRAQTLPSRSALVSWDQIPADKLDVAHSLTVKSCVRSSLYTTNNCITKTVKVTFAAKPHAAPLIDRRNWLLGLIQHMRSGTSMTFDLPVADAENVLFPVAVAIEPKELQDEISWSKGVLTVSPKREGWKQFTLVATSGFGIRRTESFNLHVVPASWSETLILGDGLKDPEVEFARKVFPDAQVSNPALGVDELDFILRKTVFIGTSGMSSPDIAKLSSLESMRGLQNLILSSPLLNAVATWIKDDVILESRYGDLNGAPNLNKMKVIPGSAILPASKKQVGLAQKLTAESKSPMILKTGTSGRCVSLVDLSNSKGDKVFQIALHCQLPGGAKTLVAGFEWADLLLSSDDKDLGAEWLKKWISL